MHILEFVHSSYKTLHKYTEKYTETQEFDYLEKAFLILSLILYSGGIFALIISGGASEGDGSPDPNYSLLSLLFIMNYMATCGLYVLKWHVLQDRLFQILMSNYFYWVFLMYIPLSMTWSARPDETMTGSVGMFGTVLFAVYIASRFTLRELVDFFILYFGTIAILSAITTVLFPHYGIMAAKHAGSIRGIYTHKNVFAPYMVLSCCTFLIHLRDRNSNKKLAAGGLALSLALLVAAKSSSALVNVTALMTLVMALETFRFRRSHFLLSLFFISTFFLFIAAWGNTLFVALINLLGKDMTLTGRTDIWPFVLTKIQERPWFGYGFNGFWHGAYGESWDVIHAMRWDLPNSHNGFLDLILALGIVGLSLLLMNIWISAIKGIAILRAKFTWYLTWPVVFIVYLMMTNLSESSLATQNNFYTVLMTISFVSISLEFKRIFQTII